MITSNFYIKAQIRKNIFETSMTFTFYLFQNAYLFYKLKLLQSINWIKIKNE